MSRSLAITRKLNPDLTEGTATEEDLVLVRDSSKVSPVPEMVLNDEASPLSSCTHSVSLEATDDATSPGSSTRSVSLEARDDATSLGSSTRSVSLEATEDATSPGSSTRSVSPEAIDDSTSPCCIAWGL